MKGVQPLTEKGKRVIVREMVGRLERTERVKQALLDAAPAKSSAPAPVETKPERHLKAV